MNIGVFMPDRVKTSVSIERRIYKDAQKYAIDMDLGVNDVMEKALVEYLKNHPVKKA